MSFEPLFFLLFNQPIEFFAVFFAILLAVSLHEYSHAFSAYLLGDPTAERMGRLTINPLKHLDFLGLLFLLFFGFGWGKPVPFNPYNLRDRKKDPAIIALSGPLANFILAFIFGFLLRILPNYGFLTNFLGYFVWLNILLGFFNLIPIPPLDGSHLLFSLFPKLESWKFFIFKYQIVFLIFAIIIMNYLIYPYLCVPLFHLITGI